VLPEENLAACQILVPELRSSELPLSVPSVVTAKLDPRVVQHVRPPTTTPTLWVFRRNEIPKTRISRFSFATARASLTEQATCWKAPAQTAYCAGAAATNSVCTWN